VIEYCRRTEPNDARQCRLTFFGERLLLRSSTGRNGSNCDVDVRVRAEAVAGAPVRTTCPMPLGRSARTNITARRQLWSATWL
jgi:hypothetical protein